MKILPILGIGVALAAVALAARAATSGGRIALPYTFATAAGAGQGGDWPADMPTGSNDAREEQNVQAFLKMIQYCEGTAKEGGYGALFGWPKAGRSFDPYSASGHPRIFFNYTDQAGKTLRTSAAGAYQITFTTWASYYVPFAAWCAVEGRECSGFTPGTQDSFAIFLLKIDGALDYVRAGQIDAALEIARRRWASLPGGVGDQPERSRSYVLNAYTDAGGNIA